MNLVDVIPLSRGINKETLSYFTSLNILPGAIVKVPLRGRAVNALAVSVRSAKESRLELRNADFAYKKATEIVSHGIFSNAFMVAAKKCANFHVASVGSTLFSLIPKIILENAQGLATAKSPVTKPNILNGAILQANENDRLVHYKSLIREEFAKSRSVFICLPTISDIKKIEKLLEKGVAEYSYIFHGQMNKKDLKTQWNALCLEQHPVIILATGQFLCIPRYDIGTIIVERESSRSYKSQSRPFTDLRIFAEFFAKESNIKIIFGDTMLRSETFWRYQIDEFHEIVPPTLRISTTAEQKIVDMRRLQTQKFEPISDVFLDLIKKSKRDNEKLFVFSSRRGLAPLTLCADCSTVVICKYCRAPITLHGDSVEKRYFLCHRCGERRDANERCMNCTSWKLKTLGIGIDLIFEILKEKFTDLNVQRLDSDTVKTGTQAQSIIKKFYESPSGVLVGTEMALMYLDQKIENVAVVSIDPMFSMPDFRIREKILSILVRLRELAHKRYLVQTRNIDEPVFSLTERGNLIDFYKQELKDREDFDYPPFTVIIKVSLSGDRKKVQEQMQNFVNSIPEYNSTIYPAFTPFSKGVYTIHALIKIGRKRWVETALFEKLLALPPSFSIAVDPESIL